MSYTYLDQQADFDSLCKRLSSEPELAIDTEFVRRTTYYPQLALLQIGTRDEIFLIDPEGISDWSGLIAIFESNTRIVMHSCSEDLEVFRKFFGYLPNGLFDTQVAAAFLGKGDALGYAAIVALMCDVEVDKSETQSDWSRRPLTSSQLDYAAEDVRWLLGMADELTQELQDRQRDAWVQQELDDLLEKYRVESPPELSWLRLKGLGKLSPEDWPLTQALCQWREETARYRDKPKSWIAKDAELIEIIMHRPNNNFELSRLPAVTPPLIRYNGKKILEMVANADELATPEQSPMPDLTGSERKLLKQLQKVVADFAAAQGLAQRFIANKQELSQYILFHKGRWNQSSVLEQGWRNELLGNQLRGLV